MKRYLLILTFLAAGCATTDAINADIEAWKAGTITEAELQDRLEEHGDTLQAKTRNWVELILSVAAALGVPATAGVVNFMRNRDILTKGVRVPANAHIEVPVTATGAVVTPAGNVNPDVKAVEVIGPTATVEAGNAIKL